MFADLVAGLLSNGLNQHFEVIAFKEFHLSAVLTEEQMFVPVAGGYERLASFGLMHALDDVQFFQFFERAIHGDQSQCGILLARLVKDFNRGEGTRGSLDGFDDGTAGTGEAVAVIL